MSPRAHHASWRRATFAEVGEHRALVVALLHVAAELGQGEHGHVEVVGEQLEAAGDLGKFQVAPFGPAGGVHQLEVVDDDEAEVASAGADTPRFGSRLHHNGVGVVVDHQGPARDRLGAQKVYNCKTGPWSRPTV